MGEVYRARDTRLDRTVAIKVLPQHLSDQPEVRSRMEREGRTISKLSHANICTLHDIDKHDGCDFLVMEFVEGKTLRDLLHEGSLPIRNIIPIAAQIADGLASAHEAGVVHRDLKPENLMICDGNVKILDFGLAKVACVGESNADSFATAAFETAAGTLLGTIEYMSPEQASGRPVDLRSDQFSFGLVLYEMVAGKRAFRSGTQAATLLAIVRDEPQPIVSLNPEAPPPLCWIIERCLAKEPENRYASTRDLARDLAALRERLSDLQFKRPEVRPSNLPISRTAFVGRDRELESVKELLLRRDVRLVTVTGPGGIGKSRLAVEIARAMSDFFTAGTYFVPLSPINDPSLITSAIIQTLGVRENGNQPQLDTLKTFLQGSLRSPMLLLLDNFEHLTEAAPVLAELLSAAPSLKILVTSRSALHIYDEHEFPVPPLALPVSKKLPSLDALAKYSAISLFVQRAAAVKPGFQVTEENAEAVTDICVRLDGLPLAIELAAARVKLLSPAALRTRLASRLQLLTGGARDLPARQQTLRQAIDWSYDLLNAPEQKLFRRLSVFQSGCTLEAVEAVCNTHEDLELDLLDGMSSMVDKSLMQQIEQADGEPLFVMLETIREYGVEKLSSSGQEHLTRRTHAAHYLVLGEEWAAEDPGARPEQWASRFEVEHNNFRAALEFLTETGDVEWGLRLGGALFRFWEMREYLSEGRDRLGKLLNLPKTAAPNSARMRALFAAGVLAGVQGDYRVADALTRESLSIARELGDKRYMAICSNALAVHDRDQGDILASRSLFEESIALWRELRDPLAVARALSNLANVVKLQGDYTKAHALYEEGLAIFRNLGDKTGAAWALNYRGDVARSQGDFAAARALYQQSLAIFRELGDRWGIAGSVADLGNLAREEQDYQTAESLLQESLREFQELGHKRGIARVLECVACSAAERSEPERALRLAGCAAALRKSLGAPLTPAEQEKLEKSLQSARQQMSVAAGGSAWLEGWVMPIEKAIAEVMAPASGSVPA